MPLMLGGALPTTALVMRKQGPPEHPLENALQGLLQLQSIADAQAGFVESGPGVSPPPKGPSRGKGPAGGKPTTSSSGAKRRQKDGPPPPVAAEASGQEELPQRDGTVATASRTAVLPVTAAGYGPPPARQMMQHLQPAPRGRPPAASSLGPEAYVSNTPNAGVRVMRPVLRPPPPPPAPPQHQPGTQLLHASDQAQQLLRVGGRGYGGAVPRPAASGRSRSASPPSTSTASPPPYHLLYHQGAAGSSGMPQQQATGSRMPPGHSAGGMRVGSGALGPGAPSGPGGRPMPTAGGSSGTGARPMGHQQQAMGAQQQEKPLDAPAAMGPRPLKPGAGKQHPMPSASVTTDPYHLHQAHQGGSEMRPPPAPAAAAAAARRGTWGPNAPLVGAGASAHGHPPPLPAGQHRSPPYQYPAMPRPAPGQARGPPPPSGARGLMQPQSTVKRPAAGPVAPPAPTYVSSRTPGAGVQAQAPSGHHVQQQQQQPSPPPAGPRLPQPQPGSSMVGPHSLAKHHQQVNDFPQQQSGSPAAHRPHPVQQQHPFNPSPRTRQPTQQQQQPQYHYPQHNQQQYDTSFQPQPPSHMHHLHQQQQQAERPQKMMRGAPAPGPAAPRGALRPSTSQAPPPQQQQHFAYPQHHQHAKPVAQHGHQYHLHAHLHAPEDLGRPPMAYGPPVSRKRPAPEPSLEDHYHHEEEDDEGADGQQEEEGEGVQQEEPCDEYEEQQTGAPVGCDYAPMDHSGFPQYHSHHHHHHHHHSPMYQGDGGGYAEDMVGSSGGGSEHGEDEMMMGHHVDYGSRGMVMEEGDYYDAELDDFQAQTLLVSIPTDSLDPATVIGSDPAQAKRLALAASNRASVSQDDHNLLISQEVMLVPSQVASPAILSQNQETRIKNLEKIPPAVVMALEAKLSTIPCWDVRITKEKLQQLGGIILVDSSPVLMQGERSEQVTNYAPKNFHIKCQHCNKSFHGKNALRNFELHAIFWELCKAHPAHPDRREAAAAAAAAAAGSSTGSAQEDGKAGEASSSSSSAAASEGAAAATAAAKFEMEHRQVYPCNSVSRDVVVFMEAKKPVLCNNQKKVWKLQGNLHHDTSLFQGRAWLQIPAGQSWESCKLADPISLQRFLCCRANKTLEQYETLRAHVFTWHDSGVFTACSTCNRVYQNTRAFLGHGCIRKGHDKDEQLVSNTVEQLLSLVDCSPDLARVFFQMQALSAARKQEVFDRVGKRLRAAPGTNC